MQVRVSLGCERWQLASQLDPQDYLEDKAGSEGAWRSNFASIDELADKVEEVMEDQAERGQVIRLSESEAWTVSRLGSCISRCAAKGVLSWRVSCSVGHTESV